MIRTLVFALAMLSCLRAEVAPLRMEEYKAAWKATKAYTLEVAKAMPAESYGFKPMEGEFSFAVQMLHLAHANYAWFTGVMGEKRTIPDPPNEEKETVLAYLEKTFDYCLDALSRVKPEQLDRAAPGVGGRTTGSGRDALLNMYMHTAHHRAQAIVYLRLKGVKPPEYLY